MNLKTLSTISKKTVFLLCSLFGLLTHCAGVTSTVPSSTALPLAAPSSNPDGGEVALSDEEIKPGSDESSEFMDKLIQEGFNHGKKQFINHCGRDTKKRDPHDPKNKEECEDLNLHDLTFEYQGPWEIFQRCVDHSVYRQGRNCKDLAKALQAFTSIGEARNSLQLMLNVEIQKDTRKFYLDVEFRKQVFQKVTKEFKEQGTAQNCFTYNSDTWNN